MCNFLSKCCSLIVQFPNEITQQSFQPCFPRPDKLCQPRSNVLFLTRLLHDFPRFFSFFFFPRDKLVEQKPPLVITRRFVPERSRNTILFRSLSPCSANRPPLFFRFLPPAAIFETNFRPIPTFFFTMDTKNVHAARERS